MIYIYYLLLVGLLCPAWALDTSKLAAMPYDYDLIIVGCGVGGHGAALQAASRKLKTAIVTGGDIGGTCVNRGCIPSKALLAIAAEVLELRDKDRLAKLGITLEGTINVSRERAASHATGMAASMRKALAAALKKHNIDVYEDLGKVAAPHQVAVGSKVITAENIILAPGSAPAVPPGIEVDERYIFTSDSATQLPQVPQYLAIVGSGYIGFEFAEVFSALGSEVVMIEAADRILPGFDEDIALAADKIILGPKKIQTLTGVLASTVAVEGSGGPVNITLVNAKSRAVQQTLSVDAVMIATGRRSRAETLGLAAVDVELSPAAVVPVDEWMRVLSRTNKPVPSLYCIGDANGKMMLAHVASAQGIAVVESIVGGIHEKVNHLNIPAAVFTHPEIASVGLGIDAATIAAQQEGFELGVVWSHYRANAKAIAALHSSGMVKLLYNKATGRIVGAQIIGMHASDLIQQVANAMTAGSTVEMMAYSVHSHPTVSEVMLDVYKQAAGLYSH